MEAILEGKNRETKLYQKSHYSYKETLINDICEIEKQACFIKLCFDVKKMRNATIQKKQIPEKIENIARSAIYVVQTSTSDFIGVIIDQGVLSQRQ